jgi:nucleoside 2-deoxyribosyltransferase
MKTFLAYRFTGEDPKLLEPLLITIREALKEKGIDSYCTFFDEDEFKDKSLNARQIMEHAFKIIDESDFLFVLMTSENKSEGMLMEVGYCVAKGIPIIVAVKEGINKTYVPEMSEMKIIWSNADQLAGLIKESYIQKIQ